LIAFGQESYNKGRADALIYEGRNGLQVISSRARFDAGPRLDTASVTHIAVYMSKTTSADPMYTHEVTETRFAVAQ